MKPRSGEDAQVRGLAGEDDDLLQVRDLRLAAARAGEGGQDARLVVEPLEQRGHGERRAPPVQVAEEGEGGGDGLGARQAGSAPAAPIQSAPPESA